MSNVKNSYEKIGILPVINIPSAEIAEELAAAIRAGGLNAIEVTLRNESALESIRRIKAAYPDMEVGAGTVVDTQTVDAALAAGAEFIVSPGYDEEVVDYCLKKGVPTVPGCVTATEVQRAVKKGLDVVKFFPSELNGGLDAINLLAEPFSKVRFVPTGGINFGNLGSYLSNKKILACGGSFMATAEQIKNRDFAGITAACKKALDISLGFELAHVGVNNPSGEQAEALANVLGGIFRLPVKVGNSSVFAGTAVEFMKTEYYGTRGHIGFKTNSMARAMAYLEANGIEFIEGSVKRDAAGELISAYLKEEIGGFAVHIVKK